MKKWIKMFPKELRLVLDEAGLNNRGTKKQMLMRLRSKKLKIKVRHPMSAADAGPEINDPFDVHVQTKRKRKQTDGTSKKRRYLKSEGAMFLFQCAHVLEFPYSRLVHVVDPQNILRIFSSTNSGTKRLLSYRMYVKPYVCNVLSNLSIFNSLQMLLYSKTKQMMKTMTTMKRTEIQEQVQATGTKSYQKKADLLEIMLVKHIEAQRREILKSRRKSVQLGSN